MKGLHQVSEESVAKVERFLVKTVKENGSSHIEKTLLEIAEGSRVSLSTAHKALNELTNRHTVQKLKPRSQRMAMTYIYLRNIEEFEAKESLEAQIVYLKNEISILRAELKKAAGERTQKEKR